MDQFLAHHGIEGQKWGVHNGPPYPIRSGEKSIDIKRSNLRNAKYANIDSFGKDAQHNILWITGLSGSGKSTTALGLARKNDSVIHLDYYSEGSGGKGATRFNKYLDQNYKGLRKRLGRKAFNQKEYWNDVDDFVKAMRGFSIQEFKLGNRVFVEGVQIADEWISDKNSFYKDQPLIILGTSSRASMKRSAERDGISLTKGKTKEMLEKYKILDKKLSQLSDDIGATKDGKDFALKLFDGK